MNNKDINPLSFQNGEINITSSFVGEFNTSREFSTIKDEPAEFLLFPLINTMVFPLVPQPININDEETEKIATEAFSSGKFVVFSTLKEGTASPHKTSDLFEIGVIGKIIKIIKLPGGNSVALTALWERVRILKMVTRGKFKKVLAHPLPPSNIVDSSEEHIEALVESIDKVYNATLRFLPGNDQGERPEISLNNGENEPLNFKVYVMALNSPLQLEERLDLLKADTVPELMEGLLKYLDRALQRLELQASIHMRTHEDLTSQQKQMFLKQQMRAIQEELGEADITDDDEVLLSKAQTMKWNKKTKNHFEKEFRKLKFYNPQNPEYSTQYTYLENLLSLPWENYNPDSFTLPKVEKILNRDHYGLENVKERIVEQMAVIKLRNDLKAPIICLVGPPGVGKTSLGKSIADALGREYQRISLGGMHDEAEIRGHRRTYIGSMPGRIISALAKCSTGNPVMVLDEIDKMGKDFKGDPANALLEVLDPEQNNSFHDNYIDLDYDLSKVLFIATANSLSEVSAPLLDRLEIIEVTGYIPEEKIEIASRHLISKALSETGFEEKEIKFSKTALNYIINRYTRESGVRQLYKQISKILRKIARLKASGKPYPHEIDVEKVKEYLGKELYSPETYENNEYSGVATGLAWTQAGGEILFIETSISEGKGDKLTLTGNLGDVMKESATIALQYIKANALALGIDPSSLENKDIHIHVPEGAIPKDGPSAGVTMAVSITSALTGKKVREKLAMSGEITLRGKVLPVGGIKEKILAAKRAGITDIMLSAENRKDVEEINEKYLKGLQFHYFDNVGKFLNFAFS